MITENGIVTQADTGTAWIKTIRAGACESCSSRESCGTGHSSREMVITVKNTLGVKQGDHVVVGIETKPVIFLSDRCCRRNSRGSIPAAKAIMSICDSRANVFVLLAGARHAPVSNG